MAVLRIYFVCTANVSRSPYAQIRALESFEGADLRVESAGIPGTEGRAMDPAMVAELPRSSTAAQQHRSRTLTTEEVERADLLLTMEFAHHMRILDRWPHAVGKVFGLRQFAEGVARIESAGSPKETIDRVRFVVSPNSMMLDVIDPYRRGSRAARACARELDRHVLAVGLGLGYKRKPEH